MLEKEEKQMASRLQSTRAAQACTEEKAAALEKDLSELHQQVGPVADAAEEAQRKAQIARTMSRQRQRMLHDLVSRARAVGDRLGTKVPSFTAEWNDDEAGYALFFGRFLTKQEERFTAKRNELQYRIKALEKEDKQMASRLQSTKEAQARAEAKVTALEKDLNDF